MGSGTKNILLRIISVFGYSAMGVIGGASIIGGIPVWKAALLAGITSTVQVIERLARAFANDGRIDKSELRNAFAQKAGKP